MLTFKGLELEDRDVFLHYLRDYRFNTYEYSFLTLYLWRKYCNVEYTILNDTLIIKKKEGKKGPYFMQPIGYSERELPYLIEELTRIKKSDPSILYLFRDIEESFLNQLKEIYGEELTFSEDVINFDYIYETEKLINLPGDKLRKRKNQCNQFIKGYQYELKDINDSAVIEDCLAFSRLWFENQRYKHTEISYELEGIHDVLYHLDDLGGRGMAVYVDGRIVGYTIGEKVNDRMAIIHVEKGDKNYKGIYAFINKAFAQNYLKDITYINREEDLGLARLRQAKEAYEPLKLEKKYIVNFH